MIGYFVLAVVLGGLGYYIITKYVPSMYSRIQSFIFDLTTGAEANISGNSYELRKWLREQAWNQFINNPVIGVGIGQFRYYARAGGSDLYSHNNFLEILANTGIIGFILYYGNLFLLLFQAKKTSDRRYGKEISKGYFIMGFLLSMFIMEYGQVDYYQIYFISILVVMSNLVDNFRLTCCIKPRTKFRYKKMTGGSNN